MSESIFGDVEHKRTPSYAAFAVAGLFVISGFVMLAGSRSES